MTIQRADVQDLCTDAVFERGETYYEEGRIHDLDRVGDTVAATVQGSRPYDLSLDLDAEGFDPTCTCPYDGPGECKHVVAVLLSLVEAMPPDRGNRLDSALGSVSDDELRSFIRDELARNHNMRERFLAQFDTAEKTHEAYRDDVCRLFEDYATDDGLIADAIDFSHFTDVAERYRERGRYRDAITVYRGMLAGIDDNNHLVDGAYDHYAGVLSTALDGYLECAVAADLGPDEREACLGFLAERAEEGSPPNREPFARALNDLEDRLD